jgi:hypothetical protein
VPVHDTGEGRKPVSRPRWRKRRAASDAVLDRLQWAARPEASIDAPAMHAIMGQELGTP